MDLGGWLRSLDLEEYEAAFHKNHIDEVVLPNLTAEDLRDLGVGSIGHRRKLLDAIALLRGDAEAKAKAPPPKTPSVPKQERISTRGLRFMILPNIVRWRRSLARIGVQICTGDQKLCPLLGYPEAALTDIDQVVKHGRESGHAASLLWALTGSFFFVDSYCGNYATANARVDELITLADEKDAAFWKAVGMVGRGWLLGQTGSASDAVQMITAGITAWRSTGATLFLPSWLSYLAAARAELGQLDEAWCCIGEAMSTTETTKERWFEAEVNRIAGEIALKSPEPDTAKAEAFFGRALTVARDQDAKSWELRAAMSMARLWRDQGKRDEARELLAPVYGWFTEGFDTRDLKEAKALLEELE